MAIPDNLYPGIPDRSAYQYEDDYDDVWKALSGPKGRLVLLDRIPTGRPVKNQEFYANEDITKVRTVTLHGAITSETTWHLAGTDAAYLQNGDVLVPHNAAGITESVQVDADPNTGANTISVTREHNGVTAQNHADAAVFRIIRSVPEGSELDNPEFTGTVRRTFYTGIISHTVQLTDSAMQGKPRSYQQAELDRQEAKVLLSLKGELEDLCYFGAGVARSSGVHGEALGIRKVILARAGSNIGATAERWGYKNFNSHVNWLATNGELDDDPNLVCFCTADMYAAAGLWGAGACSRVASDRTFGFEVNTIHTTMGVDVPLIWSYFQQPDEYAILNMNYISKHPLGNRSLKRFVKPVGIVGNDYESRRLVMEWGVKVKYAEQAHWLQKLVTV